MNVQDTNELIREGRLTVNPMSTFEAACYAAVEHARTALEAAGIREWTPDDRGGWSFCPDHVSADDAVDGEVAIIGGYIAADGEDSGPLAEIMARAIAQILTYAGLDVSTGDPYGVHGPRTAVYLTAKLPVSVTADYAGQLIA